VELPGDRIEAADHVRRHVGRTRGAQGIHGPLLGGRKRIESRALLGRGPDLLLYGANVREPTGLAAQLRWLRRVALCPYLARPAATRPPGEGRAPALRRPGRPPWRAEPAAKARRDACGAKARACRPAK